MDSISTLNLLTSILGFIVAGMLVFSPSQNRFVNRFLGLTFFAMAYRSLAIFGMEQHLISNTFLMGTVSFVYYLMPPTVFLYFRSMLKDEQSLRKTDWLHFLVPSLSIVLLIYYVIMGFIHHGTFMLPTHQDAFNQVKEYPFYILTKHHIFAVFVLHFFYVLWSWKLLVQNFRKKKKEHPQAKKIRNWILLLLLTCTVLLLLVLYHALLVLVFKVKVSFLVNPEILRAFALIFLFTRVLIKPDLLFGLPSINTALPAIDEIREMELHPPVIKEKVLENIVVNTVNISQQPEETIEKADSLYFDEYGWIHLQSEIEEMSRIAHDTETAPIEKDKVISYIERINVYLATEPYTNQDFDMKTISSDLQCPLYHIEYLFRYYNMYTFSEFRNVMRVQYVLKDFESGVHQDYTMEAVGLKAGFNSRSSFFRVFKTVTGTTPKQFLGSQELGHENV